MGPDQPICDKLNEMFEVKLIDCCGFDCLLKNMTESIAFEWP
jgi:hypothetical protein